MEEKILERAAARSHFTAAKLGPTAAGGGPAAVGGGLAAVVGAGWFGCKVVPFWADSSDFRVSD